MFNDSTFVFALIGVTAVLMASNRLRFDIIALLVVLTLMLSGILSAPEALSGFGSPIVMLVACLLVVGEMLDRTGVAVAIGDWILHKGGSNETRLYIVIMAAAAVLGAIMSSTAVVAIFIPIILRIARETSLQASRLLLPMSYAALISGMLTLIATTPNLVMSEELKAAGHTEFGFFSFTPVGLAVLVVAIAYMLLIGKRMLPAQESQDSEAGKQRSIIDMWKDYQAEKDYRSFVITPESPLVNICIADSNLQKKYGMRIIGLLRSDNGVEERIPLPAASTVLRQGDSLLTLVTEDNITAVCEQQSLRTVIRSDRHRQRWLWELGASTALIHPDSDLIGKSLLETKFRHRFNLYVLGLRRHGEPLPDFENARLEASDSLFVMGPWSAVKQMHLQNHEFVPMETPAELTDIVPAYRHMPVALAILAAMVLLSIFNIVPLVATVVMAALAAVFTRCMTMEDAYNSIHWSSLVLVAGMLPLADALEKTGGTQIVVDALMSGMGDAGPIGMMSVIFFLTAGIGLFLSNTASAVLVAPIALVAAESLGVSPYPFAVAVVIAASAAFVTPVSTPVVTLVVEPGRYQFMDFVKIGTPLLVLAWLTTIVVAPLLFPLSG